MKSVIELSAPILGVMIGSVLVKFLWREEGYSAAFDRAWYLSCGVVLGWCLWGRGS